MESFSFVYDPTHLLRTGQVDDSNDRKTVWIDAGIRDAKTVLSGVCAENVGLAGRRTPDADKITKMTAMKVVPVACLYT
jgi:hypothetical protein